MWERMSRTDGMERGGGSPDISMEMQEGGVGPRAGRRPLQNPCVLSGAGGMVTDKQHISLQLRFYIKIWGNGILCQR
jgi:hypothetical protein